MKNSSIVERTGWPAWIVAVKDGNAVNLIELYCHPDDAIKILGEYLTAQHSYKGPLDAQQIRAWLDTQCGTLRVYPGQRQFEEGSGLMEIYAVEQFLDDRSFLVISKNRTDPSVHGPYEAWGYQGPLDFGQANPVVFGCGNNVPDALGALDCQLHQIQQNRKGKLP